MRKDMTMATWIHKSNSFNNWTKKGLGQIKLLAWESSSWTEKSKVWKGHLCNCTLRSQTRAGARSRRNWTISHRHAIISNFISKTQPRTFPNRSRPEETINNLMFTVMSMPVRMLKITNNFIKIHWWSLRDIEVQILQLIRWLKDLIQVCSLKRVKLLISTISAINYTGPTRKAVPPTEDSYMETPF